MILLLISGNSIGQILLLHLGHCSNQVKQQAIKE